MPLLFKNSGLIDPLAFTLLGASSKEQSRGSFIGKFGTGLKYAIAITLRLGGKITIRSGLTTYNFKAIPTNFRDTNIDQIHYNTNVDKKWVPLSITLNYGAHWEPWHAMRELESNCRDEAGVSSFISTYPEPELDTTQIIVTCPAIEEAYLEKDKYFLSSEPLYQLQYLDIHHIEEPSPLIYYRGILAGKLEKPSIFSYSIKDPSFNLTEDRTLTTGSLWMLPKLLAITTAQSHNRAFITKILTAPRDTLEAELDLSTLSLLSDTFLSVVETYIKEERQNLINVTAIKAYYKYTDKEHLLYTPHKLTKYEEELLTQTISILTFHFPSLTPTTINVVTNLPEGTLGLCSGGKIYISSRAFTMGIGTLIGTCFEELSHLQKGFADCSRSFQNYLIDTIAHLSLELAYQQRKEESSSDD